MDTKMVVRLAALAFVVLAIVATAIEFGRKEEEGVPGAVAAPLQPDPLRAELARCQLLGEAGASDAACLRAWAENRRRFLSPGARPTERLPEPNPFAPPPATPPIERTAE